MVHNLLYRSTTNLSSWSIAASTSSSCGLFTNDANCLVIAGYTFRISHTIRSPFPEKKTRKPCHTHCPVYAWNVGSGRQLPRWMAVDNVTMSLLRNASSVVLFSLIPRNSPHFLELHYLTWLGDGLISLSCPVFALSNNLFCSCPTQCHFFMCFTLLTFYIGYEQMAGTANTTTSTLDLTSHCSSVAAASREGRQGRQSLGAPGWKGPPSSMLVFYDTDLGLVGTRRSLVHGTDTC